MRRSVPGLSASSLGRFLARVRRSVGVDGQVHLLVTGSGEVRELNRRFRGKNEATDVLSFPSTDAMRRICAGDVAISAEIAARSARLLGHTTAQEIKILALHGALHLAGYDHESDDGTMARKERRLRRALKLPVGLIERNRRPMKKATAGAATSRKPKPAGARK